MAEQEWAVFDNGGLNNIANVIRWEDGNPVVSLFGRDKVLTENYTIHDNIDAAEEEAFGG